MKSKYRLINYLFIIIFLTNIVSCSNNIKIAEVTSAAIADNALFISISFKSDVAADAYVAYWLAGTNTKGTSAISVNKLSHNISLQGLISDSEYSYQVHLKNAEITSASKIYNFTTGSLPEHLPAFELVVANDSVSEGFIMLRKMNDPGAQIIINNKGEIVWYQLSDSVVFRPFSLNANKSYLALKATDEIVEMNLAGDTLLHLNFNGTGFDKKLHHEIFRDSQRQIVAITKETKAFDLSDFGGSGADFVTGDGILILDSLGNKVWSWSIFDAMDIPLSEQMRRTRGDWSHANALSKDLDGNFLISFRNFNQIWKIDATDGHVIWKLGDNGDFELDSTEYFRVQHAVHVNPKGDIMLFDNIHVVGKRRVSRAIAFKIDEVNKLAETTMVVDLPDSLFSFKQGNVSFIAADKLLFCSSMSNKIAITNLQGEVLWQVNSEQSFYRAEYIGDKDYFQQLSTPHQR